MDAAELMDDMERFENESRQADLAFGIMESYASTPTDPHTDETVVLRAGETDFVLGAVVVKGSYWLEGVDA